MKLKPNVAQDENYTPVRTIDVEEGQRRIIYIRATFPITTPGCLNLLPGTRCNPSHTFRMSTQKVLLSNCSFQLSNENPTSFPIVLSPIPTQGTVFGPYVWPMNFAVQGSIQGEGSALAGCKSADRYVSKTEKKSKFRILLNLLVLKMRKYVQQIDLTYWRSKSLVGLKALHN